MVDHHTDEPDVYMREFSKKFHYALLRENLAEFNTSSDHNEFENLREFAVETLLKYGVSYIYNPNPKKSLCS